MEYEIQSEPFEFEMNELPDILVLVHPLMKEKFQRYGNCVGFDTTYHTIKEKK
jgi:hypothetical protein